MGRSIYRHNYRKLYPKTDITPEVMRVLVTSDRKMEYDELDKKLSRIVVNQEAEVVVFIPAKEDSYEQLVEERHFQFTTEKNRFENAVLAKIIVDELLEKLSKAESSLIRAIYLEGLTEGEYAAIAGVDRSTIGKQKRKILSKLKKYIKFA